MPRLIDDEAEAADRILVARDQKAALLRRLATPAPIAAITSVIPGCWSERSAAVTILSSACCRANAWASLS